MTIVSFLSAGFVATVLAFAALVQGVVALIELRKKSGHPKGFLVSTAVCIVLAIFIGYTPYISTAFKLVTTQTPTITASSSTPNFTTTSSSSSPTPSPTTTPTIQSSATVTSGLIKKNIMLTCHTCTSDPILATLNSIQIDTANRRMIWDITLKNIASGPNYQYNITKYDLKTSDSLTPISGSSLQQYGYFSGSVPDDVQVVFTTIPFHNVTYTFTFVVNQNFYAGAAVTFDPVNITF